MCDVTSDLYLTPFAIFKFTISLGTRHYVLLQLILQHVYEDMRVCVCVRAHESCQFMAICV